jgi:hypothetical protein
VRNGSSAKQSLEAALRKAFDRTEPPPAQRRLYSVSLDGHDATGFTTHYRDGRLLPKPAALSIVQFEGDAGFYLLYLDEASGEMTDTYHDDLEGAFSQANLEFGVAENEWTSIIE